MIAIHRPKSILPFVIVFLLGALCALWISDARKDVQARADAEQSAANPKRSAAARILPSVVSITVTRTDNLVSSGSGFIIDSRGHIVTNKHVIAKARSIVVSLADKRRCAATVRGVDSKTDLAVLKISATGLAAARWGDSDALQAGDDVLAVGNPFGYLSHTVTAGIVSATGRDQMGVIRDGGAYAYEDFIQTDAIINPGNSGGPLVNIRGEVVGVNVAIISKSGLSQKVGLAIPASAASFVVQRLISEGKVVRGLLGAAVMDIDYDLVRTLRLATMAQLRSKLKIGSTVGVYISEISGKPARKAGLKVGDIVTEVGGTKVTDTNQFRMLIARRRPDSTVRLALLRKGARHAISVKLGEQPD